MTEINRRRFLGILTALPLAPYCATATAAAAAAEAPRLASAVSSDDGVHSLLIRRADGQTLFQHPLPARAHQVLVDAPRQRLVVVSRRPGYSLEVIDYRELKALKRIAVTEGGSFYGHAELSADGRYLMTTEASAADDEGRVVFRDVEDDYRVVREIRSGGVGPHELRRFGDTLIVANGGIRTEGREKTNLDTMQPSLVRLDIASGEIRETHRFDETFHQASIRHIDLTPDGAVLVAMQYEGTPRPDTPLAAIQRPGEAMTTLPIPAGVHAQLRQYCGSACVDSSGRYGAISAPRGNQMMFWDLQEARYLGQCMVLDGCGLARGQAAGEFYASSGVGRVYRLKAQTQARERIDKTPSLHWDNHMVNLA
ncbi:DUF1513 domain-containing protein [Granulosicoccaceae sp. 1_MG-2023]|nr:DUF1513 domain-containing protein [Granulosicoccaceae sp. 1_MG-2023]